MWAVNSPDVNIDSVSHERQVISDRKDLSCPSLLRCSSTLGPSGAWQTDVPAHQSSPVDSRHVQTESETNNTAASSRLRLSVSSPEDN